MPLGSDDDFSSDDLAILAEHGIKLDPQADEDATEQPASSEQATEPKAKTDDAPEQQADDDKPTGNVNAALRASRRAERRAREEAERLKKELEELRSKAPVKRDDDDLDLAELENDFPAAAAALKKEREAREAAERRAAELAPKDTQHNDFVPESFPDAVQDAIDDVPQLLAWQNSPDQTAFALAKAADAMLAAHPKWRDRPLAERFAEAVKRVSADLDEPAPKTTTEIAQERIKGTQRKPLNTLSDLGGSTPADTRSNVDRYARMTDDEIFEDLARGG